MKVLFVCKSNVGRSQMAQAMFNKFSKRNSAASAGVDPAKYDGKTLKKSGAFKIIKLMKAEGIDVSENKSRKITKSLFGKSDLVVSMVSRGEMPSYSKKSKKVLFWRVPDPRHGTYADHVRARRAIKNKVKSLVKRIG